jgi:hypothetical protein
MDWLCGAFSTRPRRAPETMRIGHRQVVRAPPMTTIERESFSHGEKAARP